MRERLRAEVLDSNGRVVGTTEAEMLRVYDLCVLDPTGQRRCVGSGSYKELEHLRDTDYPLATTEINLRMPLK